MTSMWLKYKPCKECVGRHCLKFVLKRGVMFVDKYNITNSI